MSTQKKRSYTELINRLRKTLNKFRVEDTTLDTPRQFFFREIYGMEPYDFSPQNKILNLIFLSRRKISIFQKKSKSLIWCFSMLDVH